VSFDFYVVGFLMLLPLHLPAIGHRGKVTLRVAQLICGSAALLSPWWGRGVIGLSRASALGALLAELQEPPVVELFNTFGQSLPALLQARVVGFHGTFSLYAVQ
jgi:hypothetical protein